MTETTYYLPFKGIWSSFKLHTKEDLIFLEENDIKKLITQDELQIVLEKQNKIYEKLYPKLCLK